MWTFSVFCAVEGCEKVVRTWDDITAEEKDRLRAEYSGKLYCARHEPSVLSKLLPRGFKAARYAERTEDDPFEQD